MIITGRERESEKERVEGCSWSPYDALEHHHRVPISIVQFLVSTQNDPNLPYPNAQTALLISCPSISHASPAEDIWSCDVHIFSPSPHPLETIKLQTNDTDRGTKHIIEPSLLSPHTYQASSTKRKPGSRQILAPDRPFTAAPCIILISIFLFSLFFPQEKHCGRDQFCCYRCI